MCGFPILAAAPAFAGTIGISNTTLIFGADLGEPIAISATNTAPYVTRTRFSTG